MSEDRDDNTPAEWGDAGWDQATFWHRQAETSPSQPLDPAPDVVRHGPDGDPESGVDGRTLVAGASATRSSSRVVVAVLVVVVVVGALAFAGLRTGARNGAPGSAGGGPQAGPLVVPAPSSDPPLETSAPAEPSPPDSPAPQSSLPASADKPPRSAPPPTKSKATTVAPKPAPAAAEFQFYSRVSGKPFGVLSGSTQDGARIVAVSTGGPSARWRLVYVGGGFYVIVNAGSRKALDNPDGSTELGTAMQQWSIVESDDDTQQWQFVDAGNGYLLVLNRASGQALDLRNGGTADGTVIQQWEASLDDPDQQWLLVSAG